MSGARDLEVLNERRAELDREERALDRVTNERALSVAERRRLVANQEYFRPAFDALSISPPTPRAGEAPFPFRVRATQALQPHADQQWRRVDLVAIARSDPTAFERIEQQVVQQARQRGLDWGYNPSGGLRERKVVDAAGNVSSVFHGDPHACWDVFGSPSKVTVKKFWNGQRRVIYPK